MQANTNHTKQSGFTILELTIAVAVFSVVLLIVAAGLLAFSHSYFQGINASNTQATARSIMDDVVQSVEFGTQVPQHASNGSGVESYCIDNAQYVYQLGKEIGAGPPAVTNALARSPSCTLPPTFSGRQELLGNHMRVANFSITQVGSSNTYAITVSIAFGDGDLLIDSAGHAVGAGTTWPNNVHCKSQVGSQFCAVSTLTTTAQKRLAPPT